MCGCGSPADLEALTTPLGSTVALFIPPTLPGPRGIPLIGTFPVPAEPAARANPCENPPPPCPPRANEAAGGARTIDNTKAIFNARSDIAKLFSDSLRGSRERDVGFEIHDPIKLDVRSTRLGQNSPATPSRKRAAKQAMERLAHRQCGEPRAALLRRFPHIPRGRRALVTSSSAAVGCSAMVASKSALVAFIFTAITMSFLSIVPDGLRRRNPPFTFRERWIMLR
jgi:hypothetical protein